MPSAIDLATGIMRLRLGIFLLILSYLLGWPALAAMEAMALAIDSKVLALYGGPGIYLFSWLLLGGSIVIGGPEAAAGVKRWLTRRLGRKTGRPPL